MAADEHAALSRWFWRALFSHRYSGNPQRNIKHDIEEAVKLRQGEKGPSRIFRSAPIPASSPPTRSTFARLPPRPSCCSSPGCTRARSSRANSSTSTQCWPNRIAASTTTVTPGAALLRAGFENEQINTLANFASVARQNRTISDKLPSAYRGLMPVDANQILASALIPESLFADSYEYFLGQRANIAARQKPNCSI